LENSRQETTEQKKIAACLQGVSFLHEIGMGICEAIAFWVGSLTGKIIITLLQELKR